MIDPPFPFSKLITRNYQTNTPNNIKKVISSNRPTGIKTENIEKKILVEKYLKPETKSINTLDTKNQTSRVSNNQNNRDNNSD